MNRKTTPLKVVHYFHKYLNANMNWAYNLLRQTPNIETIIATPLLIHNQFFDPHFDYWQSPFQIQQPSHEDQVSLFQRKLNGLAFRMKFGYWWALEQKLAKHRPDFLHAHFANAACAVMPIAKKLKIPLITSFYGYDYEKLPFTQPKYQALYQSLFHVAEKIICEGEHGVHILKKMGCPEKKLSVVRLGKKITTIPMHERAKKKEVLRLIQVASFTEKKGQLDTLKAFHQALQKCPNMNLTFAGKILEKPLYAAMVAYIKQHSLENKIELLDFIEWKKLHTYLKDFEVFIHPSRYASNRDCEGGAPIVLLDAQATGMPVLSTRHCDIPAEVIDGQTGFLCEEGAVNDLARNIEQFYQMDEKTYKKMSQEARKHVSRAFDLEKSGQALSKLYMRSKTF